ncbi:hypothetical protein CTI12_AA414690 [Artemisia annua]|uniref:Uncharacterized protein n=1 Tax=Artemisia annua TaxID=35608 RepID=A0A2U1M5L2_ARTAN|nr:hypothetical protein CTI12_AA414690 [Artemisia annua]
MVNLWFYSLVIFESDSLLDDASRHRESISMLQLDTNCLDAFEASRWLAEKIFLDLFSVSVINGPFIDGRTTRIESARGGFTIHCLDPLGYIRPYPRTGLGDLLVHHAIALGLHTTTLILVKDALDVRGSKLMLE